MRLSYELAVVGQANVARAFASIERRVAQHNQRVTRATGVSARQVASGSAGMSAGQKRIQQQIVREQKQMHRSRMAAVKTEERARIQAERSVAREQQAQERRADRLFTNRARNRLRQMRERARDRRGVVRDRARRLEEVRGIVGGKVDSAGEGIRSGVRTVGSGAATALGISGSVLVGSAMREASTVDRMARRLIINSRGPGQKGLYTPDDLTSRIQKTALDTGINQESIAGGLGSFVEKTGDLKTAVENMKTFATIAQATGADFTDVASAAADLSSKMDIKSVEDMKQAFATLTFQGKQGAFELRNMASEFPEILAVAQGAGIKGTKGVTELGGFLQIARTASGSAEETTTSVQQFFNQLAAKAGDIQSGKMLGKKVDVYEGGDQTGKMRNFREVLADIISASGGDQGKILDIFDIRGTKAVRPLVNTYKEAKEASLSAGGTKEQADAAGRKAIMDRLDKASAATGTYADVETDARSAMVGSAAELEKAFLDAKITLAKELMPAFTEITKSLTELAPMVKVAAKWISTFVNELKENPVRTIGALIAAKVAFSIMTAGIGNAVKSAIVNTVSGRWANLTDKGGTGVAPGEGGGAAATGGKPGAKPKLGAQIASGIGTGAWVGLSVATAIISAGVASFEAGEANMELGGAALKRLREAAARGDVGDAKAARADITKRLGEANKEGFMESTFGRGFTDFIGTTANKDAEVKTLEKMESEARRLEIEAENQARKNAAEQIEQFGEAVKTATANVRAGGGSGPNRGNAPGTPSPI